MGSESVIISCLHKPVYTLFTFMLPVFFFFILGCQTRRAAQLFLAE